MTAKSTTGSPVGLVTAFAAVALAWPTAAQEFPDSAGKETFLAHCGSCHSLDYVRAGKTPTGWLHVAHAKQNMGVPVPREEWSTLARYLIEHFPEQPRPPAVVVNGPVKVTFKLWPVPTLGSRPSNAIATRDGMIWFTGQTSNVVGRLNPTTGDFKEYPLLSEHTGPSGAAEDKRGHIWFTGTNAGLIGRLDPRTGAVKEYRMPDPEVRDPHSLHFDAAGMLWFTAPKANVIGRLDPASGDIRLVRLPTPDSRPYGLSTTAKGVPVAVLFGTNKVATVDPATMAVKEYALPNAASRPRRLALQGDDVVWYTDFPRGVLGRLDLASGAVREFPSPSGPKSMPYGIVFTKGALWYTESGTKPNTIVRFDPRSEKFQSWPIPGGGDIVRHMDSMPNGNPVTVNSLVNQVGLIEVH